MSKKKDDANQAAFERGQDAWRDHKDGENDNPYPPVSSYHDFWRQGWDAENEIHNK